MAILKQLFWLNLKQLHKNELDKACTFTHDTTYSSLAKRIVSDKVDGAHQFYRNPKYDGYRKGFASMFFKLFDNKTGSGASVNEELGEKLHKPVNKQSKGRKIYARFKGNILGADLTKIGSISSKIRSVKYLQCVLDVFTK